MSHFALAQSARPVAEWHFDESSGQVAHDSVSGVDDGIGGLFCRDHCYDELGSIRLGCLDRQDPPSSKSAPTRRRIACPPAFDGESLLAAIG